MNISGIVITTRTRSAWQAINLGVIMARSWYWPLFFSWFIPSGIVALLTALFFPSFASWLPITLVWWLKPFWDRGPLLIASRKFFGEPTSLLIALKSLFKLYATDWFMWLSFRRFSPTRSFDLPVSCLEGLTGSARRSRLDVLHREGSGESIWTLILLVHLEIILVIAIVSLVYLLVPDKFETDAIQFFKQQVSLDIVIYNVLVFLAMATIAPFYTVCGFSQYINRRIGLEGWGIELQFRQLVKNHTPNPQIFSHLLCFVLVSFLFLFPPINAQAKSIESDSVSITSTAESNKEIDALLRARSTAKEVINSDAFHQLHEKSSLRLKNSKKLKNDDVPSWIISFAEFLEKHDGFFTSVGSIFRGLTDFFGSLSRVMEFIIWCIVIALIVWVIYLYRDFFKRVLDLKPKENKNQIEEPELLFGLDVRSSSLPDRPIEEVNKLWASREYREAISLLYRATLIHLINEKRVPFRSGFTERDCYRVVQNTYPDSPLTHYFEKLSNAWELIAYAHRVPDEASIQQLLVQWPEMIVNGK